MSTIIAIAGGSGSGKSTLAYALLDKHPAIICIQHLDDYMKKSKEVELYSGFPNYDHPSAIRFDDLLRDLLQLQQGKPVQVMTKSERINPLYKTSGRIPYTIEPKPFIILEGFLALYSAPIRNFLDLGVYLDLPFDISKKRRTKEIARGYEEMVLKPMQQQYVEPTKKYANLVIPVEHLSVDQIIDEIEKKIRIR